MTKEFKIKDESYQQRIDFLSKNYDVASLPNGAHELKKFHRILIHVKSGKPIWFDLPIIVQTTILSNHVVKFQVKVSLKKIK